MPEPIDVRLGRGFPGVLARPAGQPAGGVVVIQEAFGLTSHIRDICATIYHLLGIDPEMPVYDRANRPIAVAQGGRAIKEIMT